MKRLTILSLILLAVTVGIAALWSSLEAQGNELREPGGTPEGTREALLNPDEYAWKLFLFLNHQALAGRAGVADSAKKSIREYDDDKDVVWETWALSSGGHVNKSEVFKNPATEPVPWEQLRSKTPLPPKVLEPPFKSSPFLDFMGHLPLTRAKPDFFQPFLLPPEILSEEEDESRMNRSTYESVRKLRLYSVEGLEARYEEAAKAGRRSVVTFEQDSKEVKARWIRLREPDKDKKRYHWRSIQVRTQDGTTEQQVWGLAALHIITRDLPNWFWADFGHMDFEQPCQRPEIGCARTDPRDGTTRDKDAPSGKASSGKDGVRNETVGSKWSYYILRGTQVDFVDTYGNPTILSNPIIEIQNEQSSCITCHARAAVAPRSLGLPAAGQTIPAGTKTGIGTQNLGSRFTDTGAPDTQDFLAGKPTLQYLQTDFLWSMPFRAYAESKPEKKP